MLLLAIAGSAQDFSEAKIYTEGLFYEELKNKVASFPSPKILNLFAYTGAATLACSEAGADVVHVDSSKTSVAWARRNAEFNKLDDRPIRWIVDDVRKFVHREIKRGTKYHGIILDPPSFGRGGKGEVWKIEQHLVSLLADLAKLLDDNFLFVFLTSHSHGYSPAALANLLLSYSNGASVDCGEMLIAEEEGRMLPKYFLIEDSPLIYWDRK